MMGARKCAVIRHRAPIARPGTLVVSKASLKFTGPNQGAAPAGEEDGKVKTVVRDQPKVGRNEPCPCGSGKKYKKCHGING